MGMSPTAVEPEQSEASKVRVGVSISRKVNLGNYESADVWMAVTGIAADTTLEDVEAALAAGALGYKALKAALTVKIQEIRVENAPHWKSSTAGQGSKPT